MCLHRLSSSPLVLLSAATPGMEGLLNKTGQFARLMFNYIFGIQDYDDDDVYDDDDDYHEYDHDYDDHHDDDHRS